MRTAEQASGTALIELPNTERFPLESQELATLAAAMPSVIETQEHLDRVAFIRSLASGLKKKIEAEIAGPINQAHKLHKTLTNMRTQYCIGPEGVMRDCDMRIRDYHNEQERKRAEAHREQMRIEAEAREAARKAAEEERINKAVAAEQAGDTEQAERLMGAPIQAKPVYVPRVEAPAPVKTETMHMRDNWRAEVVDKAALPLEFLMPDMPRLNARARIDKENFSIPGAVARNEPSVISK